MNVLEDETKLYRSIVNAMVHWQHVEIGLYRVFVCLTRMPDQRVASSVFFAAHGFATKLDMVDAAAQFALMDQPHLNEWKKLKRRAAKLSTNRNKIAHYMPFVDHAEEGSNRFYMRPNIFDAGSALTSARENKKFRYHEKDVSDIANNFAQLYLKLDCFSYLLCGEEPPFTDRQFSHELKPIKLSTKT